MNRIFSKLWFTGLLFCAAAAAQEKVAVLVPGFFNKPGQSPVRLFPYFSKTIVDAVRDSGYTPVVIDDLDPVGSLSENGDRLRRDMVALVSRYPKAKFTAITHSAGGLYLAYALTERPDLPVTTVVTISAPYNGADLVDLVKWIPGFNKITDAVDLSSLREFEGANMAAVMAELRIPQSVRWIALGASQPTCLLLTCARAEYQTWLLSLAWRYAKKAGDGVVSVNSAVAGSAQLRTLDGGIKTIETWPDFVIPLEHWKVVLDAKFFMLLGETDTGWIDSTQRQVISQILARLNSD